MILKIIIGDSVIRLNKDSIFGYCDNENNCFRFVNHDAYKIINPSEKILLYSKTYLEGGFRNHHRVTKYFFSENAFSPLYALSNWNLKVVFFNDVSFLELLDLYFNNDKDLTAYDSNNKMYFLNRVFELSKQKTNAITNN